MRQETTTRTVYKFSELDEKAQEAARIRWAENGWDQDDEYMSSIKALAEHFSGKARDWSVDWSNSSGPSSMDFDMPAQEDSGLSKTAWAADIRGKLRELGQFNRRTLRGHGDCKLTGMCYDENAIDGFRWAFYREGERDLTALMGAAFDTWIKAAWEDYQYDVWGEGFAETCEANEYEFDESGRMI